MLEWVLRIGSLRRQSHSPMRIFVNEKKVNFRKRLANIASLVGLVVLIAGMIITFRVRPGHPQYSFWIAVALGALLVGFLAAQTGNYNLRRFGRSPRMDELLELPPPFEPGPESGTGEAARTGGTQDSDD